MRSLLGICDISIIVAIGFDDYYMGVQGERGAYMYKFIFLCAIASFILGMVGYYSDKKGK